MRDLFRHVEFETISYSRSRKELRYFSILHKRKLLHSLESRAIHCQSNHYTSGSRRTSEQRVERAKVFRLFIDAKVAKSDCDFFPLILWSSRPPRQDPRESANTVTNCEKKSHANPRRGLTRTRDGCFARVRQSAGQIVGGAGRCSGAMQRRRRRRRRRKRRRCDIRGQRHIKQCVERGY